MLYVHLHKMFKYKTHRDSESFNKISPLMHTSLPQNHLKMHSEFMILRTSHNIIKWTPNNKQKEKMEVMTFSETSVQQTSTSQCQEETWGATMNQPQ